MRDGVEGRGLGGSGHVDGAPPPELALRALREALVAVVSEPEVREYLQGSTRPCTSSSTRRCGWRPALRAVEHAAAERDRRLARLDEEARALVRQGLDEWAAGGVTYLSTPGRRSGAYWYATAAGLVEAPWSRRVVRLLSHEEFVRWAGLPEVPKAGEAD